MSTELTRARSHSATKDTLRDRALAFRSLHVPGTPLVLPNVWDTSSARIVVDAGAAAVATTSAGLAWDLGAADGDRLDRDRALEAVARIAAAVEPPVTADIESGYAEDSAGADGIFVPGAVEPGTVKLLVDGIDAPLNVMAGPGAPTVAEPAALGVARVSVGSGIAQAAHALVRRAARELLGAGTYETPADGLDYGELNALLGPGGR